MNTFQVIVLSILISVVAIGSYYVIEADRAGILGQAVEGNRIAPTDAQIARATGTYTCTAATGCKNDYTLTLREDGEGELATSLNDGAETVVERGEWSFGQRGYLTLDLFSNQSGYYDLPKTFLIRSIGTSTLSRIVYSTKQYQDMIHPIFVKQSQ